MCLDGERKGADLVDWAFFYSNLLQDGLNRSTEWRAD